MLKRSYLLPVAVAVVLVAAACGGGASKDVPAPPQETQTTSPTAISSTATAPEPSPAVATAPSPLVVEVESTGEATPGPTEVSLALVDDAEPVNEVSLAVAADELSTVDVVRILKPSVVQIVTESIGMGAFNQPIPSRGVGTGVILDELGHVLTNNHVVAGGERITVILSNGDSFAAELVGGDANTDTAVIRIDADGLQPAKLGRSSELEVGEDVIAIGHALGLPGGPTVSKGVVSALDRSIDSDAQTTIVDLIQTDAAINPGNSGGALVNTRAEVIGINTAIIQGSQGIGFAINIDDAKVVASQLIDKGYVERGFLGITPVNLDAALANRFDLSVATGILVARVIPNFAADAAGLREADVIVELGDDAIANNGELSKFLLKNLPGETVRLVYYRGTTKVITEITLGDRPSR
jgi:serine protease Do